MGRARDEPAGCARPRTVIRGDRRWVVAAASMAVIVTVAACLGPSIPTPAPGSSAPTSPSATATPAGTPVPTPTAGVTWRIGVLTTAGIAGTGPFDAEAHDGAVRGAAAVGAAQPAIVQAESESDAGPLLEAFVEQGFNLIVASVGLEAATATAARAHPDVWYVGMDHDPCLDANGEVDPTRADCTGDVATLLPNYIAIGYAEDQAGYLAGIAAASLLEADVVGAIGGSSRCAACIRYLQGFVLGARSVDPGIDVRVGWVADDDLALAFDDRDAGRAFGRAFIEEHRGVDVVFQVARTTGLGVMDAACDAGIMAIGADVDHYESSPAVRSCLLTSAQKHLAASVSQTIVGIADGTGPTGRVRADASQEGIGLAAFRDAGSLLAADTPSRIEAALAAMRAGTLVTCPADTCGSQDALPLGDP